MKISVATSQFAISADIIANCETILNQIEIAGSHEADVIHFPEASLSGYAGVDFASFEQFDWKTLKASTQMIMAAAKEHNIWVILGSAHPLSGAHKPHNCMYVIDNNGMLVDRYDKMFCSGDMGETVGDLSHYSPGNHFAVFDIKGVRCGVLICYDFRFPELYREYKKLGVQLMFHGFHAGHVPPERYETMTDYVSRNRLDFVNRDTIPSITMHAGMIASASNNYMWISCPNSSAEISCFPSFFVRPDGVVVGRLEPHNDDILLTEVDTTQEYYDSTVTWRERAMNGIYHSGNLVHDDRTISRQSL